MAKKAKTIGIISIKGGVGKTTVTSNLASALANKFNQKVLIIDANFSAPNLALHYGLVNPDSTLHHVLHEKIPPKEAVYETGHGYHIMPGEIRGSNKVPHFDLKTHVDSLRKYYDYILIDSSPNLNTELLPAMVASDVMFAVTTPDYPTLSCTMHAVRIAKRKKTPIAGLILNRVYGKKFELTVSDIEESAECPIVAVLPHDIKAMEGVTKNQPHHLISPRSEAAIEYNKLASAITKLDYKDPRISRRLSESVLRRISQQEINRTVLEI